MVTSTIDFTQTAGAERTEDLKRRDALTQNRCHLGSPDCQLSNTVNGGGVYWPTGAATRSRVPSATTSQPPDPAGSENRGCGVPSLSVGFVSTATDIMSWITLSTAIVREVSDYSLRPPVFG